jgi:hypothetical protein
LLSALSLTHCTVLPGKRAARQAGSDGIWSMHDAADCYWLDISQAKEAVNTALAMEHLGELITALQPTKNAVVRLGAILLVKKDGAVVVQHLNAAQLLRLNHNPQLALSPGEIIDALKPEPASAARPEGPGPAMLA